jgi:CheY-like chemotaxis protein
MTGNHKTILLVEDDPTSRKLIRTLLKNRDYTIDEAEDLDQARQWLTATVPDLVLLDLRLKDKSGLELAAEIRSAERLKNIPIIVVTAQALKGDENRVLEAGCDAYVSKPIDTRHFPEQVEHYLNNGRGHAHA